MRNLENIEDENGFRVHQTSNNAFTDTDMLNIEQVNADSFELRDFNLDTRSNQPSMLQETPLSDPEFLQQEASQSDPQFSILRREQVNREFQSLERQRPNSEYRLDNDNQIPISERNRNGIRTNTGRYIFDHICDNILDETIPDRFNTTAILSIISFFLALLVLIMEKNIIRYVQSVVEDLVLITLTSFTLTIFDFFIKIWFTDEIIFERLNWAYIFIYMFSFVYLSIRDIIDHVRLYFFDQ